MLFKPSLDGLKQIPTIRKIVMNDKSIGKIVKLIEKPRVSINNLKIDDPMTGKSEMVV